MDDNESIYNIMKDKEMYTYTPDKPWESIDDANEFIKLVLWLYDLNHRTFRHFFAITEKLNGKIVGFCGVGGIAYDRTKNEVFYSIGKTYWRKGYATEAAEAMLKYAFSQLNLGEIIGAVHPDNIASKRVMEKIGMKRAGVISGLITEFDHFNGEFLYSLSQDEYGKQCSRK